VVDSSETQDSYFLCVGLEGVMVLNLPMTDGELDLRDRSVESSVGVHGFNEVAFIEHRKGGRFEVIFDTVEM
jgi:hypothetical protein